MMTDYIKDIQKLPPYLVFPRFLLGTDLTPAQRQIYMQLLDGLRCESEKNGWVDSKGRYYLLWRPGKFAALSKRGRTAVWYDLRALEAIGLIEKIKIGKRFVMYVKYPCASNNIMENPAGTWKEDEKGRYGVFGNVRLSKDDIAVLKDRVKGLDDYINRLSAYQRSTGKEYKDHAATILRWAYRDGATLKNIYEDFGECDSL